MRLSKPEKVAREIEALDAGWEVHRYKAPGDPDRKLVCTRGDVQFEFVWRRGGDGKDRYFSGFRDIIGKGKEPWFNVAAAVRLMAKPDASHLSSLPDDEALAELAGREITWRNSVSGKTETGVVPTGGLHLKLGGGVLYFTDVRGFHSVRVAAIEKVS